MRGGGVIGDEIRRAGGGVVCIGGPCAAAPAGMPAAAAVSISSSGTASHELISLSSQGSRERSRQPPQPSRSGESQTLRLLRARPSLATVGAPQSSKIARYRNATWSPTVTHGAPAPAVSVARRWRVRAERRRGQSALSGTPITISPRRPGPITIDGDLDEGWRNATRVEKWYETNPGDNTEPKVKTSAIVTYDDHFFYAAFDFDDPDPARSARRSPTATTSAATPPTTPASSSTRATTARRPSFSRQRRAASSTTR